MRSTLLRLLTVFAALSISETSFSHSVGTSYITVDAMSNTATLSTRVDVSIRELEFAIGLDDDNDGNITWGELKHHTGDVESLVVNRLTVARKDVKCSITPIDLSIDHHAEEPYAALTARTECSSAGAINIRSDLLFDLDDTHRTLLTIRTRPRDIITVLSSNSRAWNETHEQSPFNSISRFIVQGIWHIWTGFDHLAFLMLLLLPLARESLHVERAFLAERARQILKVVTAFTVAHSITLACAALGYIDLPSRWSEAAIAASIIVAAIANLLNRAERFGIAMAFGFGLIHGLGFASALADITATTTQRVLPLIGFNLGVECGQLVVVAAVFPILFLARYAPHTRMRIVSAGSAAMGLLGVAWLLQRTVWL